MEPIPVMVVGLPGKMATMAAERIANLSAFRLATCSLTGPQIMQSYAKVKGVGDEITIDLFRPDGRADMIRAALKEWPGLIIVDYTQPDATNANAEFYCANGIPFVMGTTGGNREALKETVEKSNIPAVIAPNMSIPVVLFMSMMEYAAGNFKDSLEGFSGAITESHQAAKKDKSGTAIAVGKMLKILGVSQTDEKDIGAVRDPKIQQHMGIPPEALGGHGHHCYSLGSPDGSVLLEFTHNVNGRQTYVDGTQKALEFLVKKVAEGTRGKCYSMIDVLRG